MKGKIKKNLETEIVGKKIYYREKTSSTQDMAKKLVSQGSREGTVVIAKTQKTGKGRKNRDWRSPEGGIYMSIIFRPEINPSQTSLMPLLGGVAVAEPIQEHYELKPELKWPNDIEINGKKIGGILTETSTEKKHINWIVMGFGLNVNTEISSLPRNLRKTATSLREEIGAKIPISNLAGNILKKIDQLYLRFQKHEHEPILGKWKKLTSTLGSRVVITNGDTTEGRAVDIDKDGSLLIENEKGKVKRVTAGDVSLRKTDEKS